MSNKEDGYAKPCDSIQDTEERDILAGMFDWSRAAWGERVKFIGVIIVMILMIVVFFLGVYHSIFCRG